MLVAAGVVDALLQLLVVIDAASGSGAGAGVIAAASIVSLGAAVDLREAGCVEGGGVDSSVFSATELLVALVVLTAWVVDAGVETSDSAED